MEPIWGRKDPGGPHVDPLNFAIWACIEWPRQPFNCHWVSNSDLASLMITQVRHEGHSPCVKWVLVIMNFQIWLLIGREKNPTIPSEAMLKKKPCSLIMILTWILLHNMGPKSVLSLALMKLCDIMAGKKPHHPLRSHVKKKTCSLIMILTWILLHNMGPKAVLSLALMKLCDIMPY